MKMYTKEQIQLLDLLDRTENSIMENETYTRNSKRKTAHYLPNRK